MKSIGSNRTKITGFIFMALLFAGCSDYLDNPLKDKNTGEDVNLLVLDFNFFNTRLSFKVVDAETGATVTAPATLYFSGENGDDIVNYSGEKKPDYTMSTGQLELTVDPNITISETSPLQFAVHADIPGYYGFSHGYQLRSVGKHTFELEVSKISDNDETVLGGDIDIEDGDTTIVFSKVPVISLKSAPLLEKPHEISYAITIADFLKFRDSDGSAFFDSSADVVDAYRADPENFMTMSIRTFSNYSPGIDVIDDGTGPRSALFQKLETGELTKLSVTGRTVADLNGGVISSAAVYTGDVPPDIFGFAEFGEESWHIKGSETVYESLGFKYTLIKASADILCEIGSSITFQASVKSSFSIDADIYDTNGNFIRNKNFKGTFPETFVFENTPNTAVNVVFRNNNPSFQDIPSLSIENFCNGSYTINVEPTAGYEEYQIVLKALCPDEPTIAVAPTYSAEMRIKDSDDPWQGIDMVGGVSDFLGLPNEAYEMRLLWKNDWEYSTYYTEFDADGNYLQESSTDANITSKKLSDGRIQINVEQEFKQSVCEDMGW